MSEAHSLLYIENKGETPLLHIQQQKLCTLHPPRQDKALGETNKSGDTECHMVYACSRHCYRGMRCKNVWVMYV